MRLVVVFAFALGCSSNPADPSDASSPPDASSADAVDAPTEAAPEIDAGCGAHAKPLSFTPWILLDADNGKSWSDADGKATVDDTFVFEGNHAFKMHADKGTPNNGGLYGSWGAIESIAPALHKGDTIHAQIALYLPTTFDWSADPWLKFLRVHTMASDGTTNHGYDDIYIYNEKLNNIYEGQQTWKSSSAVLVKGCWQVVEYELVLDDVAIDQGGTGRVRIWISEPGGMRLALERTDTKTLGAASDLVDGFYVFTYWNSGQEDGMYPTQAQDAWVDRVVIEKDMSKLTEKDSAGNAIIAGVE
ncbi:MAG TPA: hypothetical protein VGH28_33840 [Polyangiaceae bacterium]|jgi:hypothetical protein